MKWYSVKKYKPVADAPLFMITAYGEIWSGKYSENALGFEHPGFVADMDAKLIACVTHFCIPDPVEIEE